MTAVKAPGRRVTASGYTVAHILSLPGLPVRSVASSRAVPVPCGHPPPSRPVTVPAAVHPSRSPPPSPPRSPHRTGRHCAPAPSRSSPAPAAGTGWVPAHAASGQRPCQPAACAAPVTRVPAATGPLTAGGGPGLSGRPSTRQCAAAAWAPGRLPPGAACRPAPRGGMRLCSAARTGRRGGPVARSGHATSGMGGGRDAACLKCGARARKSGGFTWWELPDGTRASSRNGDRTPACAGGAR